MKVMLAHFRKTLLAALAGGLVSLFFLLPYNSLQAQEWNRLLDLRGKWKFEIGDRLEYAQPGFDDASWQNIFVPANWEDEGFPGYDGYAWYRTRFQLPPGAEKTPLYLHLGRIDDADETYLNGHLIGFSGVFPPGMETAYSKFREYRIPPEYLNFSGENVLAVRVYDMQLAGGIVEGRVGIYTLQSSLAMDIPLDGAWKFSTGDEPEWKAPDFDDRAWKNLVVPLRWEVQGYRHYDGYAWYRKRFTAPSTYRGQKLVLLLGKIDDLDETYLNGRRIGKSGNFTAIGGPAIRGDEWQQLRVYEIPAELLYFDRENLIAVRVYDGLVDGGIYEGPVGIMTAGRAQEWLAAQKRGQKAPTSFWEFLDAWFKK